MSERPDDSKDTLALGVAEDDTFDLESFLRNLTRRPGVYRMIDGKGEVIYVGKARNLRNRVTSYFRGQVTSGKVFALRKHMARIEVTVTETEAEALMLEYNLIKRHRPRFNVTLRDDKSFPYVHLSSDHEYPRLSFYRGSRSGKGRYFGPYPNAYAVRETLSVLQRLFQIRPCRDSFFQNRTRPCLQYQIKRCSGPCVGLVDRERYARDIEHAVMFLEGNHDEVISDLVRRMEEAAEGREYERAAQYRDQIATLRKVRERDVIAGDRGDADVIAVYSDGRVHGIANMFIRGGRNLGTRNWFPRSGAHADAREVLSAFIAQYYLSNDAPAEILTAMPISNAPLLEEAFEQSSGHKVSIRWRLRGVRAQWVAAARANAEQALKMRLASSAGVAAQLEALRELVGLDEVPQRIECFDISHTGGEQTVASCVVFGSEGPLKSDYRRFNITGITGGDDYAAMRQALTRRYTRVKRGESPVPDVLIIDGGKGQMSEARAVLEDLQLEEIVMLGVAKGPTRKAGFEQLYLDDAERPLPHPEDGTALRLIQQVRDEAHRFAITGHRQRRSAARNTSVLESIHGLGPKKRRDLLRHFGGLQGVSRAGIEDLVKVPGISHKLAAAIHETLRDGQ
ncbi:MAG: excinuclease ABC subunit UvrC [Pseudomonadota bacterium]